ncbi:2-dehydropantoate 2-reductase [Dyella terrae]|uniref:2-dehydropantoate 2-reductase n=2 Tax=Dyella TaxID=231454 RepID=A0A4R0YS49_9GAMM|nr:2-dehydropantoate 2-reductase [Dyella terrae]TCI08713.1 2-dehydropantoate 2-reductase [Dyella soli]
MVVYGAGSIGCYIGGRLHLHARVRLIVRPRMADVLLDRGLTLTDLHGYRQHTDGHQLDLGLDPHDAHAPLVLVTVKSADTAQVGAELAPVLSAGTTVISFQNGLDNAQVLRAALPRCTVLAGMVPFNVLQREPGVFHQGTDGQLMADAHPALARAAPAFASAGLPLDQRDDMPAVQRAKLLFNLNNAINALSDLPLREELADRDWRRCLALAQREAIAIFKAAHLPLAKLTPLPSAWLPAVLSLPDALYSRVAKRMLAIDPLARSSTWEDLRAGRRTEVDAIHGAIVRLAQDLGRQAPVNARIIEWVRAQEASPRTWTAAQLRAAMDASVSSDSSGV